MSRILLLEDVHQFTPSPQSLRNIVESSSKGTLRYPVEIEGRMSVIGIRNENNRRYTLPVWQKQLDENSQLRQLIKARRSVGLLEHPTDGTVSLNSPISHVLMDVRLEGSEIFGKIGFINTAEGNKMIALIEAGFNPLVSSRGYGSVVKAVDGVDEVQEDYVCEGWDVVWNPSFKTAEMDGNKIRLGTSEAKTESKTASGPIVQGFGPDVEVTIHESVQKTADTYTNMSDKFKSIRESLAPIANVDTAKMPPQRIVETLSRCGELHRQAASVGATEPALSWDVHQVHTEISAVETRLTEAMSAPQRRVEAMNEQSIKTLKTLKIVAEQALKLKAAAAKYLGESKVKSEKLKETVERGHGWVKRAKIAEAKLEKVDAKYQYACETVDEMKLRYEADTTALGRRLLQLEFADKFADETLAKTLNEAKCLKDLIAIRETCEGKIEEFKEPDGKELKVSGGKGPGEKEAKGKEKATKDSTKSPGKDETLADKKDTKDEEGKKEKADGSKKESVEVSDNVLETVGSKAGPGEVEGKEKATKDAAKLPGKSETLADKKDTKDEEGEKEDAKGKGKGGSDKGTAKGGKEESTPGVRDNVLVEATPLGTDRLFDVTELAGSIRRLSESRK